MQCSAGIPLVLAFMWMPFDMKHLLKRWCGPSAPSMAMGIPTGRDTPYRTAQELPRQCDKELKALTWPPHCPAPNPVEHLQEAQPCSMHKAKYLLPTPTSQTPQDDPRGPVSMQSDPQWASIDHSCLETSTWVAKPKVSPEEHLMVTRLSLLFTLPFSDFNVMADRCINVDHSHSFQ